MHKLLKSRISLNVLYPKHFKNLLITNNLAFLSQKKYTPMMPLIGDSSIIFVQQKYSEGLVPIKQSLLLYSLPALFVSMHSYLTQWSIYNMIEVSLLFAGGAIIRSVMSQQLCHWVQAIEMSSDGRKIYLTVPKNNRILRLLQRNQFKYNQFKELEEDLPKKFQKTMNFRFYIPISKTIIQNAEQFKEVLRTISQMNKKLLRIELNLDEDISKIKFQLTPEEEEILEKDRQRLSQAELFRKYENKSIKIQTNKPLFVFKDQNKKSQFKFYFFINSSSNAIKKYQDYILALALGYQVKPQSIPDYDQPNENQKKASQDRQKNHQKSNKAQQ